MINKKKKVLTIVCLFIISTGILQFVPENINSQSGYFFTLKATVPASKPYAVAYMELIKQHLARIGINLEIDIVDDDTFFNTLCYHRDFDLAYMEFEDLSLIEMINRRYHENGSMNIFGYDSSIDFVESLGTGKNNWFINQLNTIIPADSQERYETCWDWQFHLMNNILPCIPLFNQLESKSYWNNLIGYNFTEGLKNSWGKMFWDGLHPGQTSTSELIIVDEVWSELNPFFYSDDSSFNIIDYCLDNLIEYDSNFNAWPHLAKNWTWIDNCTLDIEIREGIIWPDYGTFSNEYLDVNDVYFSLYCWQEVSVRYSDWFWLSDFEKLDDMSIRIHIDYNADTPEKEPYPDVIEKLVSWIVPEHFLNQTQEADGVTPDITHPSWDDYSTNVWGTNLFKIDDYTEGVETVLKTNQDCWRMNSTVTNDPALDYFNRFGDYSSGLNQLRVKNITNLDERNYNYIKGKIDLITADKNLYDWHTNGGHVAHDMQSDASKSLEVIALNMREGRENIGSLIPSQCDPNITIGLAIRKAIAYAINKQEINQIIHNNERIISDHPILLTFNEWLHPNIIRYCHNIDAANAYMIAAGFKMNCKPIPDWQDVCNSSTGQSVSIKSKYSLVLIGIFGFIIIMKKRRTKLNN